MLSSLTSSNRAVYVCVDSLGIFVHSVMSPARESCVSSFAIWIPFTSLSCLVALAGASGQSQRELERRDILFSSLIWGEELLVSSQSVAVAGPCVAAAQQAEDVPLCSWFAECLFCHEGSWIFVRCTFYIYWDDCVVSILYSVDMVDYINCFSYIEPPLHSWDKSHMVSSVVCIFLEICPSYLGHTYSS